MTIKANGAVGSISGIVAYTDGSNDSFHAGLEFDLNRDLSWSADATSGTLVLNRIDDGAAAWRTAFQNVIGGLPFVTSFVWAGKAAGTKALADATLHFKLLVSFDDGTEYPVSVTYERGVRVDHLSATDKLTVAGSTAKTLILGKIQTALGKIATATTLT